MDIANITDQQRIAIIRQVELAKHKWLDTVFKELVKKGEMPQWVLDRALRGEPGDLAEASEWMVTSGYRIVDDWRVGSLGAALVRNGKTISEFRAELTGAVAN